MAHKSDVYFFVFLFSTNSTLCFTADIKYESIRFERIYIYIYIRADTETRRHGDRHVVGMSECRSGGADWNVRWEPPPSPPLISRTHARTHTHTRSPFQKEIAPTAIHALEGGVYMEQQTEEEGKKRGGEGEEGEGEAEFDIGIGIGIRTTYLSDHT